MAIKLFALNGVPDDEAEEVRELLSGNAIDFYETPAGNWGISAPAIWLNDAQQMGKARELLDQYQAGRRLRVREEYALLRQQGKHRTFIDVIRDNPIRFVAYLAAIAVVIYLSTKPFIDMGK